MTGKEFKALIPDEVEVYSIDRQGYGDLFPASNIIVKKNAIYICDDGEDENVLHFIKEHQKELKKPKTDLF